jgi:bacterioferritin (cytochrome b1)
MPNRGNIFPRHEILSYAREVSTALNNDLGGTRQAIKTAMRWTGAGERTVKNWFAGNVGPSGPHLLALMRHSDAILEIVLALAGRPEIAAAGSIVAVRQTLADALARVDLLLERR